MDSEIRIDDLCLDVSKAQGPVVMVKCHHLKGNQYWEYNVKVIHFYTFIYFYTTNIILDATTGAY